MATTDESSAKLFQGVEAFLAEFATPAIVADGRHVLPGFVNDETLPPTDQDFFVYTPIANQRHGTTEEVWDSLKDVIAWREYVEVTVQVDCYSASPVHAMLRAQTLETVIRSEAAVRFLAQYDISPLYADQPRNLSAVQDSGRYVPRWSVDLHFGYWKVVKTVQQYAESASVDVMNVDVEFPPQ